MKETLHHVPVGVNRIGTDNSPLPAPPFRKSAAGKRPASGAPPSADAGQALFSKARRHARAVTECPPALSPARAGKSAPASGSGSSLPALPAQNAGAGALFAKQEDS